MAGKLGRGMQIPAIMVAGIGASLGSVFLFGKLADEILEHESLAIDRRLVEEAREMRSPALDRAMSAVTALGEPWVLGIAAGAVGLRWLAQGRKADIATSALGLLGGAAINQVMKAIFRRKRPALKLRRALATGYSFPSGHAMITATSYGVMAYLAGRRGSLTGTPAPQMVLGPVVLLCALVGWSRVYLEVHYPTDVLAGWAAAVVWVTTCGTARGFMEPEES